MTVLALLITGGAPDPAIIAWWAAAWVVGLVTPGAPGGLGTREAALVGIAAGLHGMPLDQATALATASRLVTVGGDLLGAALAAALPLVPPSAPIGVSSADAPAC